MKQIILLMFVCAIAHAQLPEELAVTRSVVMQDADELEVSTPVRFSKLPDQKELTFAAEFEYGLGDRWELDTEVPYEFLNPADARTRSGLGDVEVAVRYGLVPVSEKPFALSAGLGVVTPSGSREKELGEGQVVVEPFFTASRWFGSVNAQFHGAWARTVTNGGEDPRDEFEYNVALLYPIRQCFLVLEGNGETNHRRTKYYVTPELIWKPRKQVEIALGVPLGVTRAAGDYGVVASVTLEFESLAGRGHDND